MKSSIESHLAPTPIGAYSQACKVGNQVFLSGQIGMDPESGQLVADEVESQCKQTIANIKAVCEAAHTSLQNVAKLTIYITDMADFKIIDDLVGQQFAPLYPARAVVQVAGLPKGAKVEMDAVAFVPN